MTLGELYGKTEPGSDEGTCYICGMQTKHGWAEPPSGKFTDFSGCYGGTVHCEHCRVMLKTPAFRQSSWLMTRDGMCLGSKDNRQFLWDALVSPPEGPWMLYQTLGFKKQGWLSVASAVNESRTIYRVAVDWLNAAVTLRADYVAQYAPLIEALRAVKVTKDSLRSGHWTMLDYNRATDAGLEAEYMAAVRQGHNPEWEVLVNAHCRDEA